MRQRVKQLLLVCFVY